MRIKLFYFTFICFLPAPLLLVSHQWWAKLTSWAEVPFAALLLVVVGGVGAEWLIWIINFLKSFFLLCFLCFCFVVMNVIHAYIHTRIYVYVINAHIIFSKFSLLGQCFEFLKFIYFLCALICFLFFFPLRWTLTLLVPSLVTCLSALNYLHTYSYIVLMRGLINFRIIFINCTFKRNSAPFIVCTASSIVLSFYPRLLLGKWNSWVWIRKIVDPSKILFDLLHKMRV